jgi:hypothetical protein
LNSTDDNDIDQRDDIDDIVDRRSDDIKKYCDRFTLFEARVSVLEAREYPYSARDNF